VPTDADYVQLTYLIIVVSTGQAAIPVISLAMIGAVYGLQVRLRADPKVSLKLGHARHLSSSLSANSC